MAAGGSSRLGQPKQLLSFQDSTLIEHAISTALSVNFNCAVVLGANYETILKRIENNSVEIFHHEEWKKGIGSSIAFGMKNLMKKFPNLKNVLVLLCDQPFINSELLKSLSRSYFNSEQTIAACNYGDSFGVPAIFNELFFSDLLGLRDDKGAKKVISENHQKTLFVSFPKGKIDIDRDDDLKYLR